MSFSGNVANNWKKFKQQFEFYMVATEKGKKSDEIKCALLLTLMGEAALDVYNTFTFAEDEVNKLAILTNKFEIYCNPKKNVTYERHKFNTRQQSLQETVDQYVTELKILAQTCEFSMLKDSLIKDRIVCGINNDQVRERLLREGDLTLERAVEICRAAEASKQQLRALADESDEQVCIVKNKPMIEGKKCQRCNTSHPSRQCPAFRRKCNKCGLMNHFERCCENRST